MGITKYKKFTWIDILKPTSADIEFIKKQGGFHPIILEELQTTSARARVESHGNYLFLTYHLPIYDKIGKTSQPAEIDFLITKNMVITVHYEELESINNFYKKLNTDDRHKESALSDSSIKIVYYLIQEILNLSQRQLVHIKTDVSNIAKELFHKKEAQLLEKISYVKRNILEYYIISKPQDIILNSLKNIGLKFWGSKADIFLSDLIGDHVKIVQQLDSFKETIESLEETNSQLLSAKTNTVMRRFEVLATLTFPLILVFSLFTTPEVDRFFIDKPEWFLFGLLASIISTFGLLLFFKKKDLL